MDDGWAQKVDYRAALSAARGAPARMSFQFAASEYPAWAAGTGAAEDLGPLPTGIQAERSYKIALRKSLEERQKEGGGWSLDSAVRYGAAYASELAESCRKAELDRKATESEWLEAARIMGQPMALIRGRFASSELAVSVARAQWEQKRLRAERASVSVAAGTIVCAASLWAAWKEKQSFRGQLGGSALGGLVAAALAFATWPWVRTHGQTLGQLAQVVSVADRITP